MDGTTASGGSGFDAALKALEDLETSVVQAREDQPDATAEATAPFTEVGDNEAPPAIIAVPLPDVDDLIASLPITPAIQPAPSPVQSPVPPAAAVAPADIPSAVVARPSRRQGWLGKAAIGMGLVSSLVSAAGLVVAERTITSAQLVVADARERQQQLEAANRLVHDLGLIRTRQLELLKAQQAQLAAAPVSSAELQHRMDSLQASLLERDPLNNVVRAIRESQTSTNARLNEFSRKMERLEAAMAH